jgi:hypothetical protein
VPSEIEIFIEYHRGFDLSKPDQLCYQSATDHLVSYYYYFNILYHYSLSNLYCWYFLQNQYGQEMVRHHGEKRLIGERQSSIRWPCTLAEGGRIMDGETMLPF